jgi:enoyl-[acyl-carrier protein] reductase II
VAALALGAEGIQMGTRFIATQECIAHPNYKEAIVRALDTDTTITGRKSIIAARTLKNEFAQQILEKEAAGASPEELANFIGLGRLRLSAIEGNMTEGSAMCGAIAGMIKEVISVAELIRRIVDGYEQILAHLR